MVKYRTPQTADDDRTVIYEFEIISDETGEIINRFEVPMVVDAKLYARIERENWGR